MKRINYIISLLLIAAVAMTSCDKIDAPYTENNGGGSGGSGGGGGSSTDNHVVVNDETFDILAAAYTVEENVCIVSFTSQKASISFTLTGHSSIPIDTFAISDMYGDCFAMLVKEEDSLISTSGTLTISKSGNDYTVTASGEAEELLKSANTFSCSYSGSIQEGGNGGGGNDEVVRKVLLEEFTGHKCVNCPSGTAKAQQLKEIYGEQLLVVSVHAGFFAMPMGADFSADYRTEAGTEWNSFFGFQSYPSGMVNRTQNNGAYPLGKDEWAEAVSNIISLDPIADIDIETEFSSTNRELKIDLTSKFLLEEEGEFYLQVCILEDSLVSPQSNDDETYGTVPVIENYTHRHVLRGAVNGTWGEFLTSTINVGEEITKSYTVTLNEEYLPEHCTILAFIYNNLDYSIVQAEEKHIE